MRRPLLFVAFLFSLASPAVARGITAERYDVTIRALDDGTIQVTETIRLRFAGGPFTYVNREVPTRMTDGIEVLGASMDGRVMPHGSGAGQFDLRSRDSRVAVRWHFAPTSDTAHDFRVSYVVRGLIRREKEGGLLEWQVLPGEHVYAIASSRVLIEGEGLGRRPAVRTRGVGSTRITRVSGGWEIDARAIDANGWVAISTPAPLADGVTPRWQERANRQRSLAPRMVQFGVVALVLGLSVVLLIWRQYPSAPFTTGDRAAFEEPPARRAPAIAAAILAGGRSLTAHAPGTLFDLAGRGVLSVSEREGRWKAVRNFTLTRHLSGALAPHESALLNLIFKHEETVDLAKASSRIARAGAPFRLAVNEELQRLGLVDDDRRAVRRRLIVVGLTLAMLGIGALALTLVLNPDGGPWNMAIMLGIELAGALAVGLGASGVELSDDGYRERERWRGFRRGLREQIDAGSMGPLQYLPYVVALGLARPLARLLKQHGGGGAALPPWFQALAGHDGSAAFAAFVGGASASAGGTAGSGAAGGGSSSAG